MIISKRISVNKTSALKECDIYQYWYLTMSVKLSNIAILNIKCSDYRCINSLISNNEAMNLMQNADLTEKGGAL